MLFTIKYYLQNYQYTSQILFIFMLLIYKSNIKFIFVNDQFYIYFVYISDLNRNWYKKG